MLRSGKSRIEEIALLKRSNECEHQNLIKLLASFSWSDQLFLVYPWAIGNLIDFWRAQLSPERDTYLARWFSKQCLGIAEGLKVIHDAKVSESYVRTRNGFLKPENILWFKDQGPLGILKISDFGLRPKSAALSRTYRSPEYGITKIVSPSCEIWALGCILLEFVTWYVQGWEGVERFSKERRVDDLGKVVPQDPFFHLGYVKGGDGEKIPRARAKKSVVNVG